MLQYMLDTNICIYVIKSRPLELREQFNRLAEQICISTITLAELYYGVEKSSRRALNLRVVEEFVARLEALPFSVEAAAHYGQVRAELERAGQLAGPHDMLIGAQIVQEAWAHSDDRASFERAQIARLARYAAVG